MDGEGTVLDHAAHAVLDPMSDALHTAWSPSSWKRYCGFFVLVFVLLWEIKKKVPYSDTGHRPTHATHARMPTHMGARARTQERRHANAHARTHTLTHMRARTHKYIFTCVRAHTHTHTHMHICPRAHVRKHTHIRLKCNFHLDGSS